MSQPYKDAVAICKAIGRNGSDAYVVNATLQNKVLKGLPRPEIDICTDASLEELQKLYPSVQPAQGEPFAHLHEGSTTFFFLPADTADASHPEECLTRMTTRMLKRLAETDELPANLVCPFMPKVADTFDGFADFSAGVVRLRGIPDQTLRQDYLRAVRAMRFSANFGIPVEPNTWMAILRGAKRVLDYVSITDIVDEWRKVEAANMATFVNLLYESMILHGLIPEAAALARIKQKKNDNEEETVFDHAMAVMRNYSAELPYDWFGAFSCLFIGVGKLYTAEIVDDVWTFHQHHRVGAKVTRKILTHLRFTPAEIDLVCHLVRNHTRFFSMLTDKGIRRFQALAEYPRLIELARADIRSRGGNYKEFNHNLKMLERTHVPEEELEPLLNGNEIMTITGLHPGPTVGIIRDALLEAQVRGDVASVEQAVDFVKRYALKEQLGG